MDLTLLQTTPPWEWPEEAGSVLLRVLEDASAPEADRLVAAELAGDMVVIDDDLAGALLGIVSDGAEPEELRGRAAIALGPVLETTDLEGFDESDPLSEPPIAQATFARIQQRLRAVYHDPGIPKEVRRRVLEASVRAPQEWHEAAVRAAFHADDELWKLTAVFCMRYIRGFDDEILQALDSESPAIHYEAVRAAATWGVDAAWPHVVGLIASARSDKPLLLAAIEAVASIRPDDAASVLSDLDDVRDEEIQEAIDEALSMAGAEPFDEDDDFRF